MRPPPRRRFIVIPCRQPSHRTRQLPAKRSPIRSRPKPDHGIHRQCRQPLVEFLGPPQQRLHLAHNPRRQRNQIACRQPVHTTTRIRRRSPHRHRRHDVRPRRRHHQSLGQSTPRPLFRHPYQLMFLERPQMIVNLLPCDPQPPRKRCGRSRFRQLREEPGPRRIERHHRGRRIVDHLNSKHSGLLQH